VPVADSASGQGKGETSEKTGCSRAAGDRRRGLCSDGPLSVSAGDEIDLNGGG
jgi:hypothetical protein